MEGGKDVNVVAYFTVSGSPGKETSKAQISFQRNVTAVRYIFNQSMIHEHG